MIHLEKERSCPLSAQEIADICTFACSFAEDNGFISSFIYERAIWVLIVQQLYDEKKNEIASQIASEGILNTYTSLLESDIAESLIADYIDAVKDIFEIATQWAIDYQKYSLSARGLFNTLQDFTGDIVNQATRKYQEITADENLQQVIDMGEKWGMNRMPTPEETVHKQPIPLDSLFAPTE